MRGGRRTTQRPGFAGVASVYARGAPEPLAVQCKLCGFFFANREEARPRTHPLCLPPPTRSLKVLKVGGE